MKKVVVSIACCLLIIASCSKKSAPTAAKEKPIDATPLFANNCARCHGADGMTGRAPNLSKLTIEKPEVIEIITKGSGHMPAFEDKLSQKEIAAVADFILALKK